MNAEPLLIVGILTAIFVGYNIGGSTTGPAFGPAVGANVITKVMAAGLMSVFFFIGAYTIGPQVVTTLGEELVTDTSIFTLRSNVAVLFFIGGALFVGNYAGVPASTSMTAVGAIAALGLATGELDWSVLGEIVVWWIVAPIIGFWVAGVVGRYFYPRINAWVAIEGSTGGEPMISVDRSSVVPRLRFGADGDRREVTGAFVVVGIGCLMGFSSGTSNIANAIAPIYGTGDVDMVTLILIGSAAVAVGCFTIARRTLDTLGNDITNLPLTAAIVVAVISSTIVVGLSAIGIPASFVVIATMSIVGLGWGRATRTTTLSDAARGEETRVSVGALTAEEEGEQSPDIGEEEPEDIPKASDLFDPSTTARVILMQNVVPIISTVGAFITFRFVPIFGF
ncbi:inorganic phosphate transporter [Haloterrigena sp. SYSU A558-1]|uniref:Phosphate transporter n=1 Tax=Haloterrigena gelatinilytica TaxID=2741724 RepID=A0A8J8GHP6_9EURY|nr:inorganic phosphate transporter [Haloterrigena gelatinilytica]NUB90214.1 inorganic phosphate transporter [Haloterrigena gelatinilytica]NUC73965.1 inorganic phosphate transporter [Haloterrigena gelatinilytica]